MKSTPSPPSMTSALELPSMTFAFALPTRWSTWVVPLMFSTSSLTLSCSPGAPSLADRVERVTSTPAAVAKYVTLSTPAPPKIVSWPPPGWRRSVPSSPRRSSRPGPPKISSLPGPPTRSWSRPGRRVVAAVDDCRRRRRASIDSVPPPPRRTSLPPAGVDQRPLGDVVGDLELVRAVVEVDADLLEVLAAALDVVGVDVAQPGPASSVSAAWKCRSPFDDGHVHVVAGVEGARVDDVREA